MDSLRLSSRSVWRSVKSESAPGYHSFVFVLWIAFNTKKKLADFLNKALFQKLGSLKLHVGHVAALIRFETLNYLVLRMRTLYHLPAASPTMLHIKRHHVIFKNTCTLSLSTSQQRYFHIYTVHLCPQSYRTLYMEISGSTPCGVTGAPTTPGTPKQVMTLANSWVVS